MRKMNPVPTYFMRPTTTYKRLSSEIIQVYKANGLDDTNILENEKITIRYKKRNGYKTKTYIRQKDTPKGVGTIITLRTDIENCSVCMLKMNNGQQIRILDCIHKFHIECIDKWLKDHSACPMCRHKSKTQIRF
jgi:hypothetical protein